MLWTRAPCSHQRTPDFLSNVMALTKPMRLSLMKAAHVAVGGAPCRKSGTWAENDGGRSPFPMLSPRHPHRSRHTERWERLLSSPYKTPICGTHSTRYQTENPGTTEGPSGPHCADRPRPLRVYEPGCRVPHISLVLREMWGATVGRPFTTWTDTSRRQWNPTSR
jgi:hypothetical protein